MIQLGRKQIRTKGNFSYERESCRLWLQHEQQEEQCFDVEAWLTMSLITRKVWGQCYACRPGLKRRGHAHPGTLQSGHSAFCILILTVDGRASLRGKLQYRAARALHVWSWNHGSPELCSVQADTEIPQAPRPSSSRQTTRDISTDVGETRRPATRIWKKSGLV
jgi:hypothetical protein